MAEERWHDFAKEKPSEDMEGRNFIVSNGHYEKIATWCGYWENEPFMGDRLCDEVVRWKFYFTPEEEKMNDATRTEPTPMKCNELKPLVFSLNDLSYVDERAVEKNFENPHDHAFYKATEVDDAIAELKKKLAEEREFGLNRAKSADHGMKKKKNEWQLKDVHHWFRMSLFDKWHKRWLELAEKFKLNKLTAK